MPKQTLTFVLEAKKPLARHCLLERAVAGAAIESPPAQSQCKQSQRQGDHLSSQETITAKPNRRHHCKKALGVEGLGNAAAGALLQLPSPMMEAQAVAHFAQGTCAPDSQSSCASVLLCPGAAPSAVYVLEVEAVGPSIGQCLLQSGGSA